MEYWQSLRHRWLAPLLIAMTRLRVSADHLSILSLVLGLTFVPLWIIGFRWTALAAILLHLVIDGLDGPLARHQKNDSPRGSFTDSFCDQLVVSAIVITLMATPFASLSLVAGGIFLVLYTAVLAIAMVRNSLAIPYSWLVRPRFFLFAAIPLSMTSLPLAMEWTVWTSNLLLGLKLVSGFFQLRSRLSGPDSV